MTHICHAKNCKIEVPPKLLMCKKHWYMVPSRLRDEIWLWYVPGQEDRKDPTLEYLEVAQACIDAVAEKEKQPSTLF